MHFRFPSRYQTTIYSNLRLESRCGRRDLLQTLNLFCYFTYMEVTSAFRSRVERQHQELIISESVKLKHENSREMAALSWLNRNMFFLLLQTTSFILTFHEAQKNKNIYIFTLQCESNIKKSCYRVLRHATHLQMFFKWITRNDHILTLEVSE